MPRMLALSARPSQKAAPERVPRNRNFNMQHSSAPSHSITDDPLQILGLRDINPGTWSGSHGWSRHSHGPLIASVNPATGKRLAQVRGASLEDYEQVMSSAVAAAAAWRQVPAPKRG